MEQNEEMKCDHIYRDRDEEICSDCGRWTHQMNWEQQNRINRKWLKDNPEAKYGGWWSI
jgi:hypothetical protein